MAERDLPHRAGVPTPRPMPGLDERQQLLPGRACVPGRRPRGPRSYGLCDGDPAQHWKEPEVTVNLSHGVGVSNRFAIAGDLASSLLRGRGSMPAVELEGGLLRRDVEQRYLVAARGLSGIEALLAAARGCLFGPDSDGYLVLGCGEVLDGCDDEDAALGLLTVVLTVVGTPLRVDHPGSVRAGSVVGQLPEHRRCPPPVRKRLGQVVVVRGGFAGEGETLIPSARLGQPVGEVVHRCGQVG
jgi:hypothetical protein